ncbi:hypothetical protein PSM7751_00993 [Pseudooceanicola marinus]|uniref:DUF4336 domain-containing protein n=1 Tax=Pseudooceanicola marinus TaxID=396013 RepID=A0A1X6YNJ0_9RHOB|nr:DUF4336 domain-containing protein [Pseudooceanicola marinus]PJE29471.1 DUF4336 domain-containing protein [Pseudooceanicola marinus]SLN26818.1 hypothetical protein PSM7751_00993 [Pseudooceanicola marinus]
MLVPFGRGLWTDEGPVAPALAGFVYPTRMAVAQLADGSLWVWSPTPMTDKMRREVDRLGEVRALVSPNHFHERWMAEWAQVCPQAQLYMAPGMARRHPDLPQSHELSGDPPPLWAGQIDQVPVPGNIYTTEVLFFHRLSRTVLVADLMQNLPKGWFGGWREQIARVDGILGEEPQVPWRFRLSFIDRKAARHAITEVLDWRADQLLMAHGPLISQGARGLLHRSFAWLMD